MTLSDALSIVDREGATAPSLFGDDEPIDVQVVTSGLTEQQAKWVREVKMLDALRAVAGMERAKRLKWIRDDRFPVAQDANGKVGATRPGWADFLRQEFDLRPDDANYEIRGLESWEKGKTLVKASRLAGMVSERKLGSTQLQEIGRANGKGPELVKRLLERPDPDRRGLSKAIIRKEVKALKTEAAMAGIQSVQALAPKAAPKPVTPKALPMSGEEKTYSLTKWRSVPEQVQELEWAQKHLEKMRKAAVAYRNSCKQLEDRMAQGIAANRNHPALMTVYSTIWKESGFDFDAALQEVTDELAEANRLWGLAMPLCHGSAKITE